MISNVAGFLLILVANTTSSVSCWNFTVIKGVFHSGILLILVTHKMSSISYWNFDSSLIGQS